MAPSPTDPLSPAEDALLRELARVALTLPRVFAAALGPVAGVSLSEYHALMHLSEAPDHTLRMNELAARTGLSLGAVTRVMRALEAQGLADRRRAAADGRGQEAFLTDAGVARLAGAIPVHRASARREIFDRLDPAEVAVLASALSRIGGGA
ncbi:MarR family winged helix-turn-helix transcriptional regulator [Demequina silvatica]|uniref:MarR family winged helix-turn-helix transcriptional regulator n=1 Tax=Demequina silvatica TaxID=1638988 RepID=UPI000783027F|nr:MarR family transcriptional regulator [Demequina silvatica]